MTAEELEQVVALCWETDVERELRLECEDADERRRMNRLWAGVQLARSLVTCEALVAGVPVPASRLDARWRKALGLRGDVVLDEALALRVNAHGPLEESRGRRAA